MVVVDVLVVVVVVFLLLLLVAAVMSVIFMVMVWVGCDLLLSASATRLGRLRNKRSWNPAVEVGDGVRMVLHF